jgi:hypothetical protein
MKCPKCGFDWDGGPIFDTLRKQDWTKKMSDEELMEDIKSSYGPPYRWDNRIQIDNKKHCPKCIENESTTNL